MFVTQQATNAAKGCAVRLNNFQKIHTTFWRPACARGTSNWVKHHSPQVSNKAAHDDIERTAHLPRRHIMIDSRDVLQAPAEFHTQALKQFHLYWRIT